MLRFVWSVIIMGMILFFGCGGEKRELYPGVVTAKSGLILRAGAGTKHAKIAAMPYGSHVSVLATNGPAELIAGEYDNWYRLYCGTNTGWAFGGFINRLGTNYIPRKVSINRSGFLALSTEPGLASLETDSGRYYTMHPDAMLFSHKEWDSFYYRLKHFVDKMSRGRSISIRLLISGRRTVVGAVFPDGKEVRLRYYSVKNKRFKKEDIRCLKARVIDYIPPGHASEMRTDKGFFGNFYTMEYSSMLQYDIPVGRFIKANFTMQGNSGKYIPKKNRIFSFQYLPAEYLQKYNLGSLIGFTNRSSAAYRYLGVLLGIE